jgi:hypothetical protein
MSNVYQQMKEAMWGAGLVRGLTGGQKNTGAGAGEGIDSLFGLRFAFRFALLAKNKKHHSILIPPSHPPPSLDTFINYVKSSIDRPYRIQSTPMASIATSNED